MTAIKKHLTDKNATEPRVVHGADLDVYGAYVNPSKPRAEEVPSSNQAPVRPVTLEGGIIGLLAQAKAAQSSPEND